MSDHVGDGAWTITSIFSQIEVSIDLDDMQSVRTTCWFVEAHASFTLTSNIQGRELC